jgi:hypothetical protein
VPFSTYASNYMLAQWTANHGLYASLHTAYSGSGANEVTGGTYARAAITWGSPASETVSLSGTPYSINVPASTTVAFVGWQDALTGGNFQGMIPLGGAAAYGFSAPSSTGILLAPGSATYAANQQVVVFAPGGSTLPGGLTAGTIYYVKSPSTDSFSLSATSGGSAITLTADGSGIVQAITPETFASAGVYSLTGGSWTLG